MMNKSQKISLIIGLLTLPATQIMAQNNNTIDEVVWVVGDEPILKSEIEANIQSMRGMIDGDPYCVVPEELAIQKLFLHQASVDSVTVSESDVSQRVEYQLNQWIQNAGSRDKLEEYMNKSISQIRDQLRDQYREMLTADEMRKTLTKDIKVTPADVRRYYKTIPADSIPYIPMQVEVEIITTQPHIPQEEMDRVKEELRGYTDRINSGESSFSTLAILYSEDGSARQGGELDYMGRATLDPAFANVAFSLSDPQKVSKIVKTEFGYHIIQLIDKRGDKIKVRHILRRPKISGQDLTAATLRLDSIADDIRGGKFTFEEAASVISDDKDTRNNHGLMAYTSMPSGESTSRFQMQELPQDVAKTVNNMKVGEVSKAFVMKNKQGQDVCAIVKLKNRINGHKATMAEDFQVLQNNVLAKRKEDKIEQWIRDKQRTTYVRINENWRNCDFKYPGWIK